MLKYKFVWYVLPLCIWFYRFNNEKRLFGVNGAKGKAIGAEMEIIYIS